MTPEELKAVLSTSLDGVQAKLETQLNAAILAQEAKLAKTGETSAELSASINKLSAELISLQQSGVRMETQAPALNMGQAFLASEQFKAFKAGGQAKVRFDFQNNTITGEGGSPVDPIDTLVPAQRMPGIVGGAFRTLSLLDVIPTGITTSNTIEFTRELSWTNDAAETREGAAKPESDITFELVDVPVRTIPHFIRASKQVLDDAPMLEAYINLRLTHGVRQRLEYQVINGNGTSPNISGILDSGNYTAATVVTADNDFDFANRIKYQVISGDYMPSFYLINPADWGRMERMKVGTGDDRYVGADGAIGYLQNGLVPTLWGLPVIASNNVASGKLICMSRDAVMLSIRQGVTVEMSDSDSDNFTKNLITIRAELRAAFSVFRPAAIVAGDLPDA